MIKSTNDNIKWGIAMFIKEQFYIGVKEFDKFYNLKNEQLLYYLESSGAKHSNIAGLGLKQMEDTRLTWVLLNWKVDVIKRPKYDDTIIVKTWSASTDKLYAYRDFEVYDQDDNLLCTATSKWVLMNIDTWKIVRMTEDMMKPYESENYTIYPNYKYPKVDNSIDLNDDYKIVDITKDMIDVNHHVHNTYYYNIALEALPDELKENQFDHFEIIYKKEIRKTNSVRVKYIFKDDKYKISIFNEENDIYSQVILS